MSEFEKQSIVAIEFNFNEAIQTSINISNPKLININDISPDSLISNTSYEYSGRHDHGNLPLLRKDITQIEIISALYEAKQKCDEFLTICINNEYGYNNNNNIIISNNDINSSTNDVEVVDNDVIDDNQIENMNKKIRIDEKLT